MPTFLLRLMLLLLLPLAGQCQLISYYDSTASSGLDSALKQQMLRNPFLIHIRKPSPTGYTDTLVSRLDLSYKGSYGKTLPAPVRLGASRLMVWKSAINGLGLFTDPASTYAPGDTLCRAYRRTRNTGKFAFDYVETVYGSYTNDSQAPNATVVIVPGGIALVAKTAIGPNTEITASYRELISLFPGDPNISTLVKYW